MNLQIVSKDCAYERYCIDSSDNLASAERSYKTGIIITIIVVVIIFNNTRLVARPVSIAVRRRIACHAEKKKVV